MITGHKLRFAPSQFNSRGEKIPAIFEECECGEFTQKFEADQVYYLAHLIKVLGEIAEVQHKRIESLEARNRPIG